MQIANRLLRSSFTHGDMDTSLTAARIFEWLGQGQRQSVRRKVQKAYDRAKEISKEYGVPLFVDGDRSIAVMPSKLRREVEAYFG